MLITVKPSRLLLGCITLTHALALGLAFVIDIDAWLKLAWVCLVLNSGYFALAKARCCYQLQLKNESWFISRGDTMREATVLGDSYITRGLMILRFKDNRDKKITSVLVLADNTSQQVRRQLRIAIKYGTTL